MKEKRTGKAFRGTPPPTRDELARVDAITDAEIAVAVSRDPDAAPLLAPAWLKKAKLVKPQPKEAISIRLDKDVLEWFRAQPRYQTRINAILRMVMEHEKGGREAG